MSLSKYFESNVDGYARVQLAQIANYTTTPVATYTHTINGVIVVSAVDVDTNTFTSVAHGLSNNEGLFPIINVDVGIVYPINVYPGGIARASWTGYYVVNKTNDTFQLSLSVGGAAIDLISNANMDLTKWHFEKNPSTISITGIPSLAKLRIKIKGRTLVTDSFYCYCNYIGISAEWLHSDGTQYDYGRFSAGGDVCVDCEIFMDYTGILSIKANGIIVKSATASTNTGTLINKKIVAPARISSVITSIQMSACYFANGTVIEVYIA
jgi:hypothetical protein